MSNSSPVISIVIVTWNCKSYVEECLTSINSQQADISTEIVVVDNASTDGTAEMIAVRFPRVCLVRSPTNLGFAKGNNLGIGQTSGKYICLINPDVNVYPDCLAKMLRYLEEHPEVGLLGPQMLGPDGNVGRSTMRFPTIWNSLCRALALDSLFKRSRIFGGFLMRDFSHDLTKDVDILNGWFWMARRDALNQVGMLDDSLFMYGDDLDWCRRFHDAKWRVVFYAGTQAVHYGGRSSARCPVPLYIAMQRANFQYWEKHHGHFRTFLYMLITGIYHLVRMSGYSAKYLIDKAARAGSSYKVRRSFASLLWLTGLATDRHGEIR